MQILGNEKNISFLKESARKGRLSHAYIISGPKGSGKKTLAYNFAAAILCENQKNAAGFSPCGICPSCKRALSKNHPDIIRVAHEKKNILSVDEIRSGLVRDIAVKPYYGPYKIYIVEDAHLMPDQAQNALLKTIEEPPTYAIIFLLAENADVFLDTIKSRSIRMETDSLENSVIEDCLRKDGADSKDIKRICAFSGGSLGLALEIAQNGEILDFLKYAARLLSDIADRDAAELFSAAEAFGAADAVSVTDILRKWYRDVLVIKSCRDENRELFFPEEKKFLAAQARRISYENINNIFNEIDEADERLEFNVNAKAVFEALLLRIRQNG